MKSYGASSMPFINSLDFRMMLVRLPHEKMAAKSPAISISCFFLKRCGTETGSFTIKEEWLYSSTFFSRKSRSSFLFLNAAILSNRLIQIRNQIAGVFDANAKADEVIVESVLHSFFPWNGRVRHRRWLADQGFHAAKTFCQRK